MTDTEKSSKPAEGTKARATMKQQEKQSNPLLWLSYATIVGLWASCQFILIPYVANCIILVTAILYVACHWSLALREEEVVEEGEESSGNSPQQVETLTASDAYQFPLVGSMSLFGLYMAFKYFDKDLVNLLIGGYFCLAGCLALTATFGPGLLSLVGEKNAFLNKTHRWKKSFENIPKGSDFLLGPAPFEIDLEIQNVDIVAIIPSAVLCYFYFMSKHWTLNVRYEWHWVLWSVELDVARVVCRDLYALFSWNLLLSWFFYCCLIFAFWLTNHGKSHCQLDLQNILGICFCLQGIRRFSLGTYKIGAILLVGLFFYGAIDFRF